MRSYIWIIAISFLVLGCSDIDGDGVRDPKDNCVSTANPAQDDTDGDDCGNVCDGDFDQDGIVGNSDRGIISAAVGTVNPGVDVTEPIGDEIVPNDVILVWSALFGKPPCGALP